MIRFLKLYMDNFGPFSELKMDLEDLGLVLIQGDNRDSEAASSNGSGKSHIFKAISWCLFGQNLDGDRHDRLIRRGEDNMEVHLEWEDGGEVYSLIRGKRDKGPEYSTLSVGGEDMSGMTLKDTQEEISVRLGLDFQTWCNTVFWGQGEVHRFADPSVSDSQRKDILKRVLRLEVLDRASKIARNRVGEATILRKEAEYGIDEAIAELSGLGDAEHLRERIKEVEKSINEFKMLRAKLKRLVTTEESIVEHIASFDELREKNAKFRKAANLVAISLKGVDKDISKADWEIGRLKSDLEKFEDGRCPTCGISNEAFEIQELLSSMSKDIDGHEANKANLLADADVMRKTAKSIEDNIGEVEGELEELLEWRDKLSEIRAEIKSIERQLSKDRGAERELAKLNKSLAAFDSRSRSLKKKISGLRKRAALHRNNESVAQFWVKGFSNQGLGSLMMDEVMPQITKAANYYLGILTDGDITVNFDTRSKLKSGEFREKMSIDWVVEGTRGTTPSGGQKKKISIATDLALMDIVSSRERAAIDLLLIDEVFDGLDGIGKARVMDLLQELRRKRGTILAISHDPSLSEMFERVVTVVREGGVSRIEQ